MMLLDFLSGQDVLILIGEITVLVLLGIFILGIIIGVLIVASARKGKFYFPRLLKPGLSAVGTVARGFCRLLGMDHKDLSIFFIKLRNKMNREAFAKTPVEKRAVFLPQCLRSMKCPAKLGPEGLSCVNCGQCEVREGKRLLQDMGYRVFIAPGSTVVKRMIKKYRFEAIIGVGCLMEVREGLEMCDQYGIPAQGVLQLRDGCVETAVNWDDVMEVAKLGAISGSKGSTSTIDEIIIDTA
jgi:hypothetical protein